MKTEEDEAFDDLARRQGAWGGGYRAKRRMAEDKLQEPKREALSLAMDGLERILGSFEKEGKFVRSSMIRNELFDEIHLLLIQAKKALAQPAQLAHIAQFMKELRPAIGPMATMGKSKTTQEWFDIVINEIERLQATQEKNT